MVKLYVIYDRVAKEAGPVFASKNDDVAIRSFHQIVSKADNPDDYCLYHVADYDSESPRVDGLLVPTAINTEVE